MAFAGRARARRYKQNVSTTLRVPRSNMMHYFARRLCVCMLMFAVVFVHILLSIIQHHSLGSVRDKQNCMYKHRTRSPLAPFTQYNIIITNYTVRFGETGRHTESIKQCFWHAH